MMKFDPNEPLAITMLRALAGLVLLVALMLIADRLGLLAMSGPQFEG